MASCRAEADLKGVGVQGDDSMMERRMVGVLNLAEEESGLVKQHKRWALVPIGDSHVIFLRSEGMAGQGLGLHRRGHW